MGVTKKICWESKLSCREKALHSKSSLQSGFEERQKRQKRQRGKKQTDEEEEEPVGRLGAI